MGLGFFQSGLTGHDTPFRKILLQFCLILCIGTLFLDLDFRFHSRKSSVRLPDIVISF